MPKSYKLKSNRGACKRFRLCKNKRIKFRKANRNHILTKKAPKRKRQLRTAGQIKKCDFASAQRLLRGT